MARALHVHRIKRRVGWAGRVLDAVHEHLKAAPTPQYGRYTYLPARSSSLFVADDQFKLLRSASREFSHPSFSGTDSWATFPMDSVRFSIRLPHHEGGRLLFRYEMRGALQLVQMRIIGRRLADLLLPDGPRAEVDDWIQLCNHRSEDNCVHDPCCGSGGHTLGLLERLGRLLSLDPVEFVSQTNPPSIDRSPGVSSEVKYGAQVLDFLSCFARLVASWIDTQADADYACLEPVAILY